MRELNIYTLLKYLMKYTKLLHSKKLEYKYQQEFTKENL